jgi:hypothetical protein
MVPTLQDLILVHNITYKKGAFAPFVYVITKLVLSGVSLSNATRATLYNLWLPITKAPYNLVNLNCCPPTDASYMSPPFCIVNTITPSAYFTLLEPVAATAET